MLLGVPLESLISVVGHDGSEIQWPDLEEPLKRKSFHIEEMEYACNAFGHYLCHYSPGFSYSPGGDPLNAVRYYVPIQEVMKKFDGLLLGFYNETRKYHAVAWNAKEGLIYDPAGRLVKWRENLFSIEAFYATIRTGDRTVWRWGE